MARGRAAGAGIRSCLYLKLKVIPYSPPIYLDTARTRRPPAEATLKSYADRICQLIGAQSEPVILLGHSMNGIAITQAAENCPKQISALVYLSAYLPSNGESSTNCFQKDPESLLGVNMTPPAEGVIGLKPEGIQETFYALCAEEDVKFAKSRIRPEPIASFEQPVKTTTEGWGRVPRFYIECLRDRAASHKLQQELQKHSPCSKTFSLDTDHSPFFSAPEQLVDILFQIGRS